MAEIFNFETAVKAANDELRRSNVNKKPFLLQLPDYDETISIDYPDAQQYMALASLRDDQTFDAIKILFGQKNERHFRAFLQALKGAPPNAVTILMEEIYAFWGMNVEGKSEE